MADLFPSTFPSGQASDLAGVTEEVGAEVGGFSPDDEVLGFTNGRAARAELVLVEAGNLTHKPEKVSWEASAACASPATAWGTAAHPVQLARRTGATVIGLASESHHGWLKSHGVIPVAYGDGAADRIRTAAPSGVDAFAPAAKHGVRPDGGTAAGPGAKVLAEVAGRVMIGPPVARRAICVSRRRRRVG